MPQCFLPVAATEIHSGWRSPVGVGLYWPTVGYRSLCLVGQSAAKTYGSDTALVPMPGRGDLYVKREARKSRAESCVTSGVGTQPKVTRKLGEIDGRTISHRQTSTCCTLQQTLLWCRRTPRRLLGNWRIGSAGVRTAAYRADRLVTRRSLTAVCFTAGDFWSQVSK